MKNASLGLWIVTIMLSISILCGALELIVEGSTSEHTLVLITVLITGLAVMRHAEKIKTTRK